MRKLAGYALISADPALGESLAVRVPAFLDEMGHDWELIGGPVYVPDTEEPERQGILVQAMARYIEDSGASK